MTVECKNILKGYDKVYQHLELTGLWKWSISYVFWTEHIVSHTICVSIIIWKDGKAPIQMDSTDSYSQSLDNS